MEHPSKSRGMGWNVVDVYRCGLLVESFGLIMARFSSTYEFARKMVNRRRLEIRLFSERIYSMVVSCAKTSVNFAKLMNYVMDGLCQRNEHLHKHFNKFTIHRQNARNQWHRRCRQMLFIWNKQEIYVMKLNGVLVTIRAIQHKLFTN